MSVRKHLAIIRGFAAKVNWEGREYYYKHYRNPDMCFSCFDNCISLANHIVDEKDDVNSDDMDMDLELAETVLWDMCKRQGFEMCSSREQCEHESLSDSDQENSDSES